MREKMILEFILPKVERALRALDRRAEGRARRLTGCCLYATTMMRPLAATLISRLIIRNFFFLFFLRFIIFFTSDFMRRRISRRPVGRFTERS